MINDLFKMAVLGLALVACAGDKDGTDTDVTDTDGADTDGVDTDVPDTDDPPDTDTPGCTLSCTDYCTDYLAVCSTDPNNTYADMAECETICAGFACGASGDTEGNTLGCRIYHTGAAATAPADHCPHAGETATAFCI